MAKQMKYVTYNVRGVRSLLDLIDMMRYDGMRFHQEWANEIKVAVEVLSRREAGIIDPAAPKSVSIYLGKDQLKDWRPTKDRWLSFGMDIQPVEFWDRLEAIN